MSEPHHHHKTYLVGDVNLNQPDAQGMEVSWWSYGLAGDCLYAYNQLINKQSRIKGAGILDPRTVCGLIVHKGMESWAGTRKLADAQAAVREELVEAQKAGRWLGSKKQLEACLDRSMCLLDQAIRLVQGFVLEVLATEVTFRVALRGLVMKGRIDLVALTERGIEVVDYKAITSATSVRWEQLRFYEIALRKMKVPVVGSRFVLPVLNQTLFSKVSDKRQLLLFKKVHARMLEVNGKTEFPASPNFFKCRYCSLGAVCPYSLGLTVNELSMNEGKVGF